jgi:hypothetical protein
VADAEFRLHPRCLQHLVVSPFAIRQASDL